MNSMQENWLTPLKAITKGNLEKSRGSILDTKAAELYEMLGFRCPLKYFPSREVDSKNTTMLFNPQESMSNSQG